jgi:hypothetical protein
VVMIVHGDWSTLRRNFVSHEPNLQPEDGEYYYGAASFTADERDRLWNTGSPGQAGRRHQSLPFEN